MANVQGRVQLATQNVPVVHPRLASVARGILRSAKFAKLTVSIFYRRIKGLGKILMVFNFPFF